MRLLRLFLTWEGVKQTYADFVSTAIEKDIRIDDDIITESIELVNRELLAGEGYSKYKCTKARLLYHQNYRNYEKSIKLINEAISGEDVTRKDLDIRISQYYYYLTEFKIRENSRHQIADFIIRINNETDKIKDVLDNQKSKYFEILAFFAGIISLIIGTISVSIKSSSFIYSAAMLIIMTGSLTFAFSIFRILISYNNDNFKRYIPTIIVIIISVLLLVCGLYLGLKNGLQ